MKETPSHFTVFVVAGIYKFFLSTVLLMTQWALNFWYFSDYVLKPKLNVKTPL